MPKVIFLYHGGNYKKNIDDGRLRMMPLRPGELDEVFYDPHVPYHGDNSIATELDMGEYADILCDLQPGDEVYVGILPDAALYWGMWAMSFNAVKGFKADFDLVRGRDVWNAWVNNQELTGLPRVPGTQVLPYDFTDGLGHNSWNAVTISKLPWESGNYDDYRNNAALEWVPYNPALFAFLGEAMYIRMTIRELGEYNVAMEDQCCNYCLKRKFPTFQVGMVYAHICADKQRWQKYCNCQTGLCNEGCGGGMNCGGDQTPPGPTYKSIPTTFKDAQGNDVAPPRITRVYPGSTVTVTPPTIDGYTTPAPQDVTDATEKIEFVYN